MPLDPKFETSAGLQRFREQIQRENKSRITCGQKPSEAALKFLDDRKKQLEEQIKEASRERSSLNKAESNSAVNASKMGTRGTAGRSGVVSSTQRHVVDEGYDMVLKTEWQAATEGVNARDPVFQRLNDDSIGAQARTIHVQREESARRVHDTRERLLHEKEDEQKWVEKAHQIVDEGWERAKLASISRAGPSDYQKGVIARSSTAGDIGRYAGTPTGTNNNLHRNDTASTVSRGGSSSVGGGAGTGSLLSGSIYISTTDSHKKTHGLASAGVRAPTFTKERHEELTNRVRCIYEKPPPPRKDIFAALDHITKTSLPKRELQESKLQEEKRDRAELEAKVDQLSKQLAGEKAATAALARKMDDLTKVAAQH